MSLLKFLIVKEFYYCYYNEDNNEVFFGDFLRKSSELWYIYFNIKKFILIIDYFLMFY